MVGFQLLKCVRAGMTDVLSGPFRESPDELLHEEWNVLRSVVQRRKHDKERVEAIVQITAELAARILA